MKIQSIARVVTVPYPGWHCSRCPTFIVSGEKAVKMGKIVYCMKCAQEGKKRSK